MYQNKYIVFLNSSVDLLSWIQLYTVVPMLYLNELNVDDVKYNVYSPQKSIALQEIFLQISLPCKYILY
jgi:hypothetical protein